MLIPIRRPEGLARQSAAAGTRSRYFAMSSRSMRTIDSTPAATKIAIPRTAARPDTDLLPGNDSIVKTTPTPMRLSSSTRLCNSGTMHATSDKAVYVYKVQGMTTNETVTLTGNAKVENAQSWLTGEPIIWDRVGNHLTATNQKMIFRQNLGEMPPTNSERTKTNLSLPKSSDAAPGVIKNVDLNPFLK